MESKDSVIAAFKKVPVTVQEVDFAQRGYHLEIRLESSQLRSFAELLRSGNFYLSFVSGLHLSSGIDVSYQFANYGFPCRLLATLPLIPTTTVCQPSPIFFRVPTGTSGKPRIFTGSSFAIIPTSNRCCWLKTWKTSNHY